MELKTTTRLAFLIYFLGVLGFFLLRNTEEMLWFAIGGGLALVNVALAAWSIRFGLENVKKSAIFLTLLLFKSLTFLTVVAAILFFLKPLVLPFTLGITIVIVGALLAGIWEARRMVKPQKDLGTAER